jgi:ankyrin repeat protein
MRMTSRWERLVPVVCAVFLIGAGGARPPLVDAARNSERDALRALLQHGASVNEAEGDGTTALHWASYRDDLESVDLLIRAGANVNAANDLGVTPLWTASENGNPAMVRRLLQAGANPNLALLRGETPLMVASRSGNADVVEQLLAKGANANVHAARGQTALMWAVAQKHPDVVKVLLAHRADIRARSDSWNEVMAVPPHGLLEYNRAVPHGGETALMFAMRVGDLASAQLLVAAGADVNDHDAWGVSATVLAAHSGFRNIVEFLLEKGADPNQAAAGFTALHEAIMRRDERMATVLLAYGADPNAPLQTWTPTRRTSNDFNFALPLVGASPLWLAARFIEPNVMRLLVDYGADPLFVHHADYQTLGEAEGYEHHIEATTILMAATGMGGRANAWIQPARDKREALTLDAVKLATELGVDVNAADPEGHRVLDAAKALKFNSVVNYLSEKGAKPGAVKKGTTAEPDAPPRK